MIEVIIGLLMLLGLIVMFAISIGLSGIIIAFYIVGGLIGLVLFWGVISAIWYWIRRLYYGVTGKIPPDDIGEILGYKQIEAFPLKPTFLIQFLTIFEKKSKRILSRFGIHLDITEIRNLTFCIHHNNRNGVIALHHVKDKR